VGSQCVAAFPSLSPCLCLFPLHGLCLYPYPCLYPSRDIYHAHRTHGASPNCSYTHLHIALRTMTCACRTHATDNSHRRVYWMSARSHLVHDVDPGRLYPGLDNPCPYSPCPCNLCPCNPYPCSPSPSPCPGGVWLNHQDSRHTLA